MSFKNNKILNACLHMMIYGWCENNVLPDLIMYY
jgi:hypothetical protein